LHVGDLLLELRLLATGVQQSVDSLVLIGKPLRFVGCGLG
jgi:hypothetical protein